MPKSDVGPCRFVGWLIAAVALLPCGCEMFQPKDGRIERKADPDSSEMRPQIAQKTGAAARPAASRPSGEADGAAASPADASSPDIDSYLRNIAQAPAMTAAPRGGASPPVISGPPAQRPPDEPSLSPDASASAGRSSSRVPVTVPLKRDSEAGTAETVRLAADEAASVTIDAGSNVGGTSPSNPAPTVGRVSVKSAPSPLALAAPPPARSAAPNEPVETSRIPSSLKGFLDQYTRESGGNGSYRQQLDERILRVLVGDFDAARAPLNLVTREQQRAASGMIESLISVREAHPADPSRFAESAVQALQQLQSTLRDLSELRIPTLALCWKVEGYGRYEEFNPPQFVAGKESEVIVYAEVAGFASEQRSDQWYYGKFEMASQLIDRSGNIVSRFREPEIVDRCRNRRTDCFIPQLIRLPANLAPGEYVLKVTLTDQIAGKVAENRTTLRVVTGL